MDTAWISATKIARAVAGSETSATAVVEAALARITQHDPILNSFTAVLAGRARKHAQAIDIAHAKGRSLGPLAGVPFAVKNLFDVSGLTTLAGSKINRSLAPSTRDSPLIERLEAAGAVLVGALNTHDVKRMTGCSSGGSGAAVAGGLVPVALGSDTNGSIRVPASLCGIFGLKPTYGRLPRNRTFPFVASFDHLGPFARTTQDLALVYDAMQGHDPDDPACAERAIEPTVSRLDDGIDGLRIAVADGYFRKGAFPEARVALDRVAAALHVNRDIALPEARCARAAAYVISATEGASLHLNRLQTKAHDFDPAVRDRLIAGALIPATLVNKAQKFRRWYRERVLEVFLGLDVILAPATPCTAPLIGQQTFVLDGVELPVRANLGIYTQPISFIGLPVVAVPVALDPLPIAIQIIAAPWREDVALRVAYALEKMGVIGAPRPAI
jgi:1-carboxybiuret hydrolase